MGGFGFGDFLNEINPRGGGFVGGTLKDVWHDDTFQNLFIDPFKNGVNFMNNFQKNFGNGVNNLGEILSGNMFYIIIGVVGVGVLAYAYKSVK